MLKKVINTIILPAITCLLISPVYSADANFKVTYQGFFKSGGVPVTATKGFVFRVRNGSAGDIQWESDCADISVSSGVFRAVLGETNVIGNWDTINWGGIDAHLEVQTGNAGCGSLTTLNSSERILSAPYALSISSLTTLLVDGSTQTKSGGLNVMGSVGIGTTSPSSKFEVSGGTLTAYGFQVTASSGAGHVPPGLVGFFNRSSCPSGWSEYITARGRYIVGLPLGGTLNATVGDDLSDQENRTTGIHAHTISPNPHTHSLYGPVGCNQSADDMTAQGTTTGGTSLTVDAQAGSVAGTNAPYLQYIVCVKN